MPSKSQAIGTSTGGGAQPQRMQLVHDWSPHFEEPTIGEIHSLLGECVNGPHYHVFVFGKEGLQ